MVQTLRAIFLKLVSEGLLAAEDEARLAGAARATAASAVPWYVRVLSGAGAWLATGMFLLFAAMTRLFELDAALIVLGLMLVGGAVALRRSASVEFLVQLALAFSFTGQTLFAVGMAETVDASEETVVASSLLILSAVLLVVYRDAVHRFLSTLVMAGCVAWLVEELNVGAAEHVAIVLVTAGALVAWERPAALRGVWAELQAPLAHGAITAVLIATTPQLFGYLSEGTWISAAGFTVAALWIERAVFRELGIGARARPALLAYGATVLLGGITVVAIGLQAALLAMLLAFHRRSPVLFAQGAALFVAFTTKFYMDLHLTLLEKSAVLALSGGLFLAAWRWFLPREEAAR